MNPNPDPAHFPWPLTLSDPRASIPIQPIMLYRDQDKSSQHSLTFLNCYAGWTWTNFLETCPAHIRTLYRHLKWFLCQMYVTVYKLILNKVPSCLR